MPRTVYMRIVPLACLIFHVCYVYCYPPLLLLWRLVYLIKWDRQEALCACRLSWACRLRKEHDNRGSTDGWGNTSSERTRWANAPDKRAYIIGKAGRCAMHSGMPKQGRCDG